MSITLVHPNELETEDLLVMRTIFVNNPSMREIATVLMKSLGMAQYRVKWLQDNKYILVPEKRGWRNLKLSDKGERVLRINGLL